MFPLLSLLLLTGCTTAPFPPANLSDPSWTVRQGQAVWRERRDSAEIAGEILVATNHTGGAFVQFTKSPFPLVIAQSTTNAWQIESPVKNERFSIRGKPPTKIIWFALPRALAGSPLPKAWSWQASDAGWRLEQRLSGEALEGYLTQ